LKMRALDTIHEREAEEERLVYLKESVRQKKLAKLRSKQGDMVDSNNNYWQGTLVRLVR
jgi:hypothetical protein